MLHEFVHYGRDVGSRHVEKFSHVRDRVLAVGVGEDVGSQQDFVGDGASVHRVVEPPAAKLRLC
jgi:hypothetical protein